MGLSSFKKVWGTPDFLTLLLWDYYPGEEQEVFSNILMFFLVT